MSQPFHFKQFSVSQDKCAMKVGTDGVLLGAWASSPSVPNSILDIGAGSGLISLMMAQRFSTVSIDAVEIDHAAYTQARDNFLASPWSKRLTCVCMSFQTFCAKQKEKYSFIVSNPPFFANGQKTVSKERNQARFEASLPFQELLYGVSSLLVDKGVFCVIIPFDQEELFLSVAKTNGLIPIRITRTKGNKNAPIKRSLLQLTLENGNIIDQLQEDVIILEKERHEYTDEYKQMVKAFYLKL